MKRIPLLTAALVAVTLRPASAGLLDTINTTFQGATGGWLNGAMNVADVLFGSVMSLYIVYVLCLAAIDSVNGEANFGTVLWPLGRMLMFLIVPLALLKVVARDVLPNLIAYAGQISGMITGSAAQIAPDDIFDIGLGKANELIHASVAPLIAAQYSGAGIFDVKDLVTGGFEAVVGLIVYLIMLVVFALVACEVLAVYLDVYVAISIGAINLGWLASRGTAYMATPFLSAVWSSVLRLIVTFAFVALVGGLLRDWTITMQANDPALFMQVAGQMLAGSFAILYMTLRLGRMTDKVSGGTAAFSSTAAIVGAASGVARTAMAAATRRAA